jgi:hypothetical protein
MRAMSMKSIAVCAVVFSLCAGPVWSQNQAAVPVKQNVKPAKAPSKQKAAPPDTGLAAQPAAASDTAAAKADSAAAQVTVSNIITLNVVTVPESAAVYLDDSLRGASPCTITGLLPGPHLLTLKKKGFYLKKAEITLDTAPVQELSFTLLQPAFLRVESTPAGAAVSIDGKKEGVSPYENDKMKPGDHAVKVELRDHVPFEKTIAVESNGRDTLRLTLDHTQAYKDSVAAAALVAEKSRRERFVFALVSALFSVCAVALVVFEASSGE